MRVEKQTSCHIHNVDPQSHTYIGCRCECSSGGCKGSSDEKFHVGYYVLYLTRL